MRYSIDARRISHERFHDEVIVINAAAGSYYSGSGTAADLWTLVSQGAGIVEATTILAAAYSCDEETVSGDIEKSIGSLIERNIIQGNDDLSQSKVEFVLPDAVRKIWTAPEFDEYTDMWDLIQLDPIHDVGDAGWPFAAPTSKI